MGRHQPLPHLWPHSLSYLGCFSCRERSGRRGAGGSWLPCSTASAGHPSSSRSSGKSRSWRWPWHTVSGPGVPFVPCWISSFLPTDTDPGGSLLAPQPFCPSVEGITWSLGVWGSHTQRNSGPVGLGAKWPFLGTEGISKEIPKPGFLGAVRAFLEDVRLVLGTEGHFLGTVGFLGC